MKFSNKGHGHVTFGEKKGFFSKFFNKAADEVNKTPANGGETSNISGDICIDWEIDCELTVDELKAIYEETRKDNTNIIEDAKRAAEAIKIISQGIVDSTVIIIQGSDEPVKEYHRVMHEFNLRETEFHKEERLADMKADKEVNDAREAAEKKSKKSE